MVTKLIKHNKGFAIEIDKSIMDALGIDQKTELILMVIDDELIIKPRHRKNSAALKKRAKRMAAITNQIMEEYAPVFRKLAKT